MFSKLKYPKHLVDSTVKTFLNSRAADQSLLRSKSTTENTNWVVIPFKDQDSANIMKMQLKDLSVKLQTIVHTYIYTLLAGPQGAFQRQIYITQLKPKYMTMIKKIKVKKLSKAVIKKLLPE